MKARAAPRRAWFSRPRRGRGPVCESPAAQRPQRARSRASARRWRRRSRRRRCPVCDVAEHLANVLGEHQLGLDTIPETAGRRSACRPYSPAGTLSGSPSATIFTSGETRASKEFGGGSRRPRSERCRCGAGRGGCRRGSAPGRRDRPSASARRRRKTSTGAPLAICCASAPEAPIVHFDRAPRGMRRRFRAWRFAGWRRRTPVRVRAIRGPRRTRRRIAENANSAAAHIMNAPCSPMIRNCWTPSRHRPRR